MKLSGNFTWLSIFLIIHSITIFTLDNTQRGNEENQGFLLLWIIYSFITSIFFLIIRITSTKLTKGTNPLIKRYLLSLPIYLILADLGYFIIFYFIGAREMIINIFWNSNKEIQQLGISYFSAFFISYTVAFFIVDSKNTGPV